VGKELGNNILTGRMRPQIRLAKAAKKEHSRTILNTRLNTIVLLSHWPKVLANRAQRP